MRSYWKTLFVLAVLLLSVGSFAFADSPGHHPAYLHALSDLRNARAFMYYKPGKRVDADEQHAIDEIEAAMHEISEAAIEDGKPMDDRPQADARWDRTDRLTRVMELLDQARKDVKEHESNGWSRDIRHQALKHIDEARKAVHKAWEHERNE